LVRTGSLAQRAGLRVGDIVVGMNGRAIGHSGDFTRALLAWRTATDTRFTVSRAGEYLQLQLDEHQNCGDEPPPRCTRGD